MHRPTAPSRAPAADFRYPSFDFFSIAAMKFVLEPGRRAKCRSSRYHDEVIACLTMTASSGPATDTTIRKPAPKKFRAAARPDQKTQTRRSVPIPMPPTRTRTRLPPRSKGFQKSEWKSIRHSPLMAALHKIAVGAPAFIYIGQTLVHKRRPIQQCAQQRALDLRARARLQGLACFSRACRSPRPIFGAPPPELPACEL